MEIKKIKEKRYYPMSVSGNSADDSVDPELLDGVWKKFDALSPEKKAVINSYEIANKILELQKKFSLTNDQIAFVSMLVRQRFFNEVNVADCIQKLRAKVPQPQVDDITVKNIVAFLENEVLTVVPLPEPKDSSDVILDSPKSLLKLPLLKAMAEYPRLSEQLITGEKIKLKNQPESVRPSLANWIHYYRDELGVGFHDQVTRGKFLFQSENGKRLSADERERVNLIVKSIEEETPVDVDTDRMQVVFPARVPTTPVSAFPKGGASLSPARPVKPFQPLPTAGTPVTPSAKNSGEEVSQTPPAEPSFFAKTFGPAKNVAHDTLEFSTGHVLPGEKAASSPARPDARGGEVERRTMPAPPVAPTSTFNMSGISRNQPQVLPRSPYSIRPLRMRGEEKDMDGSE